MFLIGGPPWVFGMPFRCPWSHVTKIDLCFVCLLVFWSNEKSELSLEIFYRTPRKRTYKSMSKPRCSLGLRRWWRRTLDPTTYLGSPGSKKAFLPPIYRLSSKVRTSRLIASFLRGIGLLTLFPACRIGLIPLLALLCSLTLLGPPQAKVTEIMKTTWPDPALPWSSPELWIWKRGLRAVWWQEPGAQHVKMRLS